MTFTSYQLIVLIASKGKYNIGNVQDIRRKRINHHFVCVERSHYREKIGILFW